MVKYNILKNNNKIMQEIDIKKLSTTELESYAYKQILAIEKEKNTLSILQQEINLRITNPIIPESVSGTGAPENKEENE